MNQIVHHAAKHDKIISGDDAFKLKDTYGLPLDEIQLLAKDAGLSVDQDRYSILEEEARERSRRVHKTTHQVAETSLFTDFTVKHGASRFLGYNQTEADGKVIALVHDGALWIACIKARKG